MSQAESDYWLDQVQALKRNELDNVQKSAAGWTTLFGAILGVFGTATFAGGLTTLDKLGDPWSLLLKISTLAVAALILVATIFTGIASFTWPRMTSNSTWQNARDDAHDKAVAGREHLNNGLRFGVAAVVLVLIGSGCLLFFPEKADTPPKPPFLLAIFSGESICGQLVVLGDKLTVGGMALDGATSITVVPACLQTKSH